MSDVPLYVPTDGLPYGPIDYYLEAYLEVQKITNLTEFEQSLVFTCSTATPCD